MTTELTAIRKKLEKKLKEERYIHTLGVMYTAASMAMRHGADVQKAMTAGLLHDCAKELPLSEMQRLVDDADIKVDMDMYVNGALLHGVSGAVMAHDRYGVIDGYILDAIRYHTTGRVGMTQLDKIIFLADYVEETRDFPGVDYLRSLALEDLDESGVGRL